MVEANPVLFRSGTYGTQPRRRRNPEPEPEEPQVRKVQGLEVEVALVRGKGSTRVKRPQISSDDAAYSLLRPFTADHPQENLWVLLLNTRNRPLGVYLAHRGTINGVEVHPADVYRAALASGAARIIVAHNHPSGEPNPSPEDIDLTKRLKAVGELLGVPLLDHLVIGPSSFVSLSTMGLL